jgi:hypothetical protein
MKLAYTMAPGRGDTDLVLERLAADLPDRGLGCCGTVQINSARADVLTLSQHHVGGHRADHGPKHAPGMISHKGQSDSRTAKSAQLIKTANSATSVACRNWLD